MDVSRETSIGEKERDRRGIGMQEPMNLVSRVLRGTGSLDGYSLPFSGTGIC